MSEVQSVLRSPLWWRRLEVLAVRSGDPDMVRGYEAMVARAMHRVLGERAQVSKTHQPRLGDCGGATVLVEQRRERTLEALRAMEPGVWLSTVEWSVVWGVAESTASQMLTTLLSLDLVELRRYGNAGRYRQFARKAAGE